MFTIIKYTFLVLIEIIKRNLPEIKEQAEILADKAFLAFDFWATLAYELLDIAVLCLVVFVKWFIHTELVRELEKATIQIITTPAAELRSCASKIRGWVESAWTFRKELVAEYCF